jgi:serine/threonine protein phosphatase PrpC
MSFLKSITQRSLSCCINKFLTAFSTSHIHAMNSSSFPNGTPSTRIGRPASGAFPISNLLRPVALSSDIGARSEQQDAADKFFNPATGNYFLIVCDGVGGSRSGGEASKLVIKSAEELWNVRGGVFQDPKGDLLRLAKVAHDRIKDLSSEGEKRPPAATIVALYVNGTEAHWIHSGDSRLYRFRAGKLQGRTRDHSVVQILVDQGEVAEKDMGTHPDQGRLLQSLGTPDYRDPTYGSSPVSEQDAFLLCTDGFWERTPIEIMATVLSTRPDQLNAALQQSIKRAVQQNGPKGDNVTAAVLAYPSRDAGIVSATAAPAPEGKRIGFLPAFILLAGLALLTTAGLAYYFSRPSPDPVTIENPRVVEIEPDKENPVPPKNAPPTKDKNSQEANPSQPPKLPPHKTDPPPEGAVHTIVANPPTGTPTPPEQTTNVVITPESAAADRPFVNGLNMKFFPVNYPGRKVLFAETETTNNQYHYNMKDKASDANVPKNFVTIGDAEAFAGELTKREQGSGLIPQSWRYRLPNIREWLHAAKGGEKKLEFIWGNDPKRPGNFGNINSNILTVVAATQDSATQFGLRDMCGNVEEIVLGDEANHCHLMGGSFKSPEPPKLVINQRRYLKFDPQHPTSQIDPQEYRGFRLVLVEETATAVVPPRANTVGPDLGQEKKNPQNPQTAPPLHVLPPAAGQPQAHPDRDEGQDKFDKPQKPQSAWDWFKDLFPRRN